MCPRFLIVSIYISEVYTEYMYCHDRESTSHSKCVEVPFHYDILGECNE